eukprot:gene6103-6341_t
MQLQHYSSTVAAASSRAGNTRRPLAAQAAAHRSRHHISQINVPQRVAALEKFQQPKQWRQVFVVHAAVPADGDEELTIDPNIPAVDQDFDLLSAEVKRLQEALNDELKGCSIYLVGMMGTGKSTTGKMLASTLKYAFFDTDNVIEMAHPGEAVSDIFSKYGEDYFRDCESQVLKELAPYKNLVVATGGGAVTRPKNWSYMHNGVVAWLRGEPELLAMRVVAQGVEKRPLLFGDGVSEEEAFQSSLSKLQSLFEERTKYYENADVVVELKGYGKDEPTGAPAAVVMHRLMEAVHNKIISTQQEREARRQFTIEQSGEVPTMKKQPAPSTQQATEE